MQTNLCDPKSKLNQTKDASNHRLDTPLTRHVFQLGLRERRLQSSQVVGRGLGALVHLPFLLQDDEMGTCAFMAYFFMAGYQFRQAQAVVKKLVSMSPIAMYVL